MTRNVHCPFCAAKHTAETTIPVIFFNGREFSWHKCIECKLLFILPFLNTQDIDKLYGIGYHNKFYFDYRVNYNKQINLLQPFKKQSILDFGCGDAGFLHQLQCKGYKVTGVEYDSLLVHKLISTFPLINFLTATEFENQAGVKYDVIHLGDVLEHVNDPVSLIKKFSASLKDDGIFFIEGPLETNPNLAYFFRKVTTHIKKMINVEKIRVKYPYHVCFSNSINQLKMLENIKLQTLYFNLSEEGFPYVEKFKNIHSLWTFLQWLIANTSIGISKIVPGWGNRFTYIGKPVSIKPGS